jgi:hypothetical protein
VATKKNLAVTTSRTRRADVQSANQTRIDPYLNWAIATDFAYLGGDSVEWYPLLLELRDTWVAQFAGKVNGSEDLDPKIRVAPIYQKPPSAINEKQLTFCTALVTRSVLVDLFGNRTAVLPGISRFELGTPVVPHFPLGLPLAPPVLGTNPPKAAVVAVIDDGLAFAHERFRNKTGGTRFKYFWNQDDTTGINPPPGFGWGRELAETEINTLLTSCTHSGIVDEDELYSRAGQNLAARRAKHGTHVMDLACGLPPNEVIPSSPYLIGVQLPRWVTTETSGGTLTPPVLDALHYILNRADQIAAQENTAALPVVVNLSYGNIAGPHDGTAPLEAAIDQLVAARPTPLRVVLPAGNHYLARCHTRFSLPAATSMPARIEHLRWRVQPDDRSGSFMQIWLPYATTQVAPTVEVRITTPSGQQSPWIVPGGFWNWPSSINTLFRADYVPTPSLGNRPLILLSMSPTAEVTTAPRTAPSGKWRVEVRNTGPAITVDAWVQRGDTPFGYPLRGRQSRFDDSRYVRFDLAGRPEENDIGPSHIRRKRTLNALATGRQAIVIGGFRRSDYAAYRHSGAGPIITPPGGPAWRDGPDATAVGQDSVALHGVLAAGTRTGSVFAMEGTSVAAPQVTRLIAAWMTLGLASDRTAVQVFATLNDPAPPLPPERGGAGRIELPPIEPHPPVERWTR